MLILSLHYVASEVVLRYQRWGITFPASWYVRYQRIGIYITSGLVYTLPAGWYIRYQRLVYTLPAVKSSVVGKRIDGSTFNLSG